MADRDEDGIKQTESASDFVNRRLIQIARTLESKQHLSFFRAMLLMRQRVDAYIAPWQTKPTVIRRALGRLPFSTRRQQLPPTESRDHALDDAVLEIAEMLRIERGLDRTQSLVLVSQVINEGVRHTASGIVTKCLTPTTAAWVMTNPRLSPMVASPQFVRAGEEVATGAIPSEETLAFLSRLADTMLEESQGT